MGAFRAHFGRFLTPKRAKNRLSADFLRVWVGLCFLQGRDLLGKSGTKDSGAWIGQIPLGKRFWAPKGTQKGQKWLIFGGMFFSNLGISKFGWKLGLCDFSAKSGNVALAFGAAKVLFLNFWPLLGQFAPKRAKKWINSLFNSFWRKLAKQELKIEEKYFCAPRRHRRLTAPQFRAFVCALFGGYRPGQI